MNNNTSNARYRHGVDQQDDQFKNLLMRYFSDVYDLAVADDDIAIQVAKMNCSGVIGELVTLFRSSREWHHQAGRGHILDWETHHSEVSLDMMNRVMDSI